ncbi:hypothetical protein PLICRDRAFT_176634 [Plicaturopsis crispa FD-325 SS-3]|nr:hypothetical protein PLICRDRAFT_176634 [Plicaturopsis crispa FD-325 SS-3]
MSSLRSDRGRKPYSRPAPRSKDVANGMWLHDKAPSAPKADRPSAATNARLIVSNLHYEVDTKDLASIFGQIGTLICEPSIRYDRSGRSTGIATISFETPGEATRAKKQFDGILAKGQPMSIAYDTSLPPAVRNTRRASDSDSLLARIQKPPLLDRLSRDGPQSKTKPTPTGPSTANRRAVSGPGPIRTKQRGGAAAGAGAGGRRAPKKPQTAEDLDKELEAFMGDEPAAAPTTTVAPPAATAGDVDMV